MFPAPHIPSQKAHKHTITLKCVPTISGAAQHICATDSASASALVRHSHKQHFRSFPIAHVQQHRYATTTRVARVCTAQRRIIVHRHCESVVARRRGAVCSCCSVRLFHVHEALEADTHHTQSAAYTPQRTLYIRRNYMVYTYSCSLCTRAIVYVCTSV